VINKVLSLLTEKSMMKGELQILILQQAQYRYFSVNCTVISSEGKPNLRVDISLKIYVFWNITPCIPLEIYLHLREKYIFSVSKYKLSKKPS
jgi:hypothetical protein